MGRAPCCDKANVKKGPWSPEEDAKLKTYIDQHGTGGNWIALPQKIGLKRCGKSCRLRWLNYLRPNIKHGGFSEEEDNLICSLYVNIGSRWSIIAAQLPGRTDNDIKNYWNTRLKKKLIGKQRKEQQAQRVSNNIKQEVKREIDQNLMVANSGVNTDQVLQPPYWPADQYYSVPMPNDYDLNINQTPFKSTVLINSSHILPSLQDQLHLTTINGGGSSDEPSNIYQGFENLTINGFSDEMVYMSHHQQMEGLFGILDINSNVTSTTTTSTESTSWGDHMSSSLVYSSLVSDYQQGCCRQGITTQDVAVEDSKYFGMQMQ